MGKCVWIWDPTELLGLGQPFGPASSAGWQSVLYRGTLSSRRRGGCYMDGQSHELLPLLGAA